MNIYAVACRRAGDSWERMQVEIIKAQDELDALESSSFFIETLEDEEILPIFVSAQSLINVFIAEFGISLVVEEG